MATFPIPTQTILANVEKDSPGITPGVQFQTATVQLTDPGTQWPATPDNTRHILVWGLQLNRNDGAGWLWWLFSGDPTSSPTSVNGGYSGPTGTAAWLPFGLRTRDGGLPFVSISSSQILENAGVQVRLAILTDADIALGASITVT